MTFAACNRVFVAIIQPIGYHTQAVCKMIAGHAGPCVAKITVDGIEFEVVDLAYGKV